MTTDLDSLRRQICDIGKRAYDKGMGAANDGNISVLLEDGSLLCTPTGVSKGYMTPDMICRIDRTGGLVEDCSYKPSSEIRMHLVIYDQREDVRAVVHAHPVYATVHAICGKPLVAQIMPESTIFLGEVPLTPYGLPSTPELAEAIIPALNRHDALLLENHGALSCGHDLQSAWFKMEALDYYAKVVYHAAAYGGPKEFSQHEIDRLVALRRTRFAMPGRHPFIDS